MIFKIAKKNNSALKGGVVGGGIGAAAGGIYNKATGQQDQEKKSNNLGKATAAGAVAGGIINRTGMTGRVGNAIKKTPGKIWGANKFGKKVMDKFKSDK